jgi:hypothetical protein
MASEAQKQELVAKLSAYVKRKYGATDRAAWESAFRAADSNRDGRITSDELRALLAAAGIGNVFTLGAWTDGVMSEVGRDDSISLPELVAAISPTTPAPRPTPLQPTVTPMQQGSALENLNNAIATMSMVPAGGAKPAIDDLVRAWVKWWHSAERSYLPDATLRDKAVRFLEWYARAYVLLPAASSKRCPDPRTIDVTLSALAADTMRRSVEAYRQAAKDGAAAGLSGARMVTNGVLRVSSALSADIARAGHGIAAPISAYGNAVRDTVLAVTGAALVYVLFVRPSRA